MTNTHDLLMNPRHWLPYESAVAYTGVSLRTLERLVADNRVRTIRRPYSRPRVYLAVSDLDTIFGLPAAA